MTRIIKAAEVSTFRQRFPALVEFGLMDEAFAIACLGADRLMCPPAYVREVQRRKDGSIVVERIT